MERKKLLFTAPLDFDKRLIEEYENEFDLVLNGAEYWVCDPLGFYIDAAVVKNMPNLKVLATPSTGLNHINLADMKRFGIKVLSLKDNPVALEEISASAEFTLKLLIDAFRMPPDPREIQGKSIGLVGFGRIGKRLYKWIQSMGAKYIVAYDPPLFGQEASTPLKVMFKLSDAVVLCCEYNKETHHMITKELIESMPKGARLVNTSRGSVIDEDSLAKVMESRPDLKVAVDVTEGELTTQVEWHRKRLEGLGAIVTPHIAGNTFDSRTKASNIILGLLRKEIHVKTNDEASESSEWQALDTRSYQA